MESSLRTRGLGTRKSASLFFFHSILIMILYNCLLNLHLFIYSFTGLYSDAVFCFNILQTRPITSVCAHPQEVSHVLVVEISGR